MASVKWLSLLVLAGLVAPSHQHAYLAFPESRNYQAYLIPPPESKYYCPHCGQGGGTGHTPSMCGDPFQDVVGNPSFVPFTNRFYRTTSLDQGQVINVRIAVSTNHGGRMSVAICPLPRDQVTQACFDLPENRLRRVNADPKYNGKWYWYLNAANNLSAEETFKLPDGVNCDGGCMFQWWWLGYQSCTMPCEDPSVDIPGECAYNPMNPGVSMCSSYLGTEQYRNCADIVIRSSGGNPTSSPPPATASPPPAVASPPPAVSSPPPVVASPPPTAIVSPPPPQASGDCPADDWRCSGCTSSSTHSPAASGQVPACYTCATSVSDAQASGCADCLTSSTDVGVISGCLSCVSSGQPGWACNQFCAQYASSGQQMASCQDCLATPGINTWGCQNCLQVSGGDASKTGSCVACVKGGMDGWTCGQCATKADPTACYACLATAGTNTWACIA